MRSWLLRQDEIDWFDRISDRHPVLWMAAARSTSWLWHATADGKVAVCSDRIQIDRDRNPHPGETDRSACLMSCERCQERVRRTKMRSPRPERRGDNLTEERRREATR